MGIKNLKCLINKYAKEAVNERFLCHYEYKIIAIDISIFLYKYIYQNGEPLELLTKQCMRFLKNKVIPLYVFDGKPPKEKNDVLGERYEKKQELINKQNQIKNLLKEKTDTKTDIVDEQENVSTKIEKTDEEDSKPETNTYLYEMNLDELKGELEKVEKSIIVVNGKVIRDCKRLFDLMGIPYLVANGEAETLCARLIKEGIVYGCLSEDTDILANGGRYFIRNFNVNNNRVIEYDLDIILKKFGVSYEQFIDICILCGCDYTSTIVNIGIMKAYNFIKKYNDIEGIIKYIGEENKNFRERQRKANKEEKDKFTVPDDFDYWRARHLFKICGDDENLEVDIRLKKPKLPELLEYLDGIARPNVHTDLKRNLVKYMDTLRKNDEPKEMTIDRFYTVV